MTTKELKRQCDALKKQLATLDINSKIYLQLTVEYHSTMAEYYDSRIGDITNKDDFYSRQWDKHNQLLDKYVKELRYYKESV